MTSMKRSFTLEYWMDSGWYVGRLKQVPGVMSQGKTPDELKENIADAYRTMLDAEGPRVSQKRRAPLRVAAKRVCRPANLKPKA
jgi:predicted RNase H-like HicB family nuclease